MLQMGIRFEAVLNAGFSLQIAAVDNAWPIRASPTCSTRSRRRPATQRAFVRLVEELDPEARNPIADTPIERVIRFEIRRFIDMPALLMVLVLAGEEIPDLLQKMAVRASRHRSAPRRGEPLPPPGGGAAPLVRRAHPPRALRARRRASSAARVRQLAPVVIGGLFGMFVHPGVYSAVGLPGWSTWRAVKRTPERVAVKHAATRNILDGLLAAGVLRRGRVPRTWRHLCGVDGHGEPVGEDVPLPVAV